MKSVANKFPETQKAEADTASLIVSCRGQQILSYPCFKYYNNDFNWEIDIIL